MDPVNTETFIRLAKFFSTTVRIRMKFACQIRKAITLGKYILMISDKILPMNLL